MSVTVRFGFGVPVAVARFFTVTVQAYFLPFTLAVIFAVPAFFPLTFPLLLTVAMDI